MSGCGVSHVGSTAVACREDTMAPVLCSTASWTHELLCMNAWFGVSCAVTEEQAPMGFVSDIHAFVAVDVVAIRRSARLEAVRVAV